MSEGYAKHSRPEEKKSGPVRKILKFIGAVLLIAVLLFAGLIGFLSATEYKPADSEEIAVEGEASEELAPGEEFSIVSWNIGYGALGDNADFFMDGGKSVKTADKERVMSNMDSIIKETSSLDPDIMFFQETDKDSSRSNHINEYTMLQDTFQEYCSSFANNFKVAFLPYPVPPIGKGRFRHSDFLFISGIRSREDTAADTVLMACKDGQSEALRPYIPCTSQGYG